MLGDPKKFRTRKNIPGQDYEGWQLVRQRLTALSYDDYSDDSGGGSSDLLAALATNASSAFTTYEVANAPVPNAALIAGGSGSSAAGSATSLGASLGNNASTLFIFVAIAVVALFAFMWR